MKNPSFFLIGASGLLLSIAIASCTPEKDDSPAPGTPTTAPAASATTTAPATPETKAVPETSAMPETTTMPVAASGTVEVSLEKFYNVQGICADNAQFSDGMDGDGFECSSNLLGTAQTWNGVKFDLGSAHADSNVVTCNGQTIPLPPGQFSKIEILAMAVNGAQAAVNFTVAYDGAPGQSFTQNMSDWFQPDNNDGEAQAITMAYRDQSDGTRDDRPFYIYGYSFKLNNANTVKGLALPNNDNVKVFAVTLVP